MSLEVAHIRSVLIDGAEQLLKSEQFGDDDLDELVGILGHVDISFSVDGLELIDVNDREEHVHNIFHQLLFLIWQVAHRNNVDCFIVVEHPLKLGAVSSGSTRVSSCLLDLETERDPVVELSQNCNSILDIVVEFLEEPLVEIAVVFEEFGSSMVGLVEVEPNTAHLTHFNLRRQVFVLLHQVFDLDIFFSQFLCQGIVLLFKLDGFLGESHSFRVKILDVGVATVVAIVIQIGEAIG